MILALISKSAKLACWLEGSVAQSGNHRAFQPAGPIDRDAMLAAPQHAPPVTLSQIRLAQTFVRHWTLALLHRQIGEFERILRVGLVCGIRSLAWHVLGFCTDYRVYR